MVTRTFRLSTISVVLVLGGLALPFAHKVYAEWPWTRRYDLERTVVGQGGPGLDLSRFDMRLADESALGKLADKIRTATPTNAMLVVKRHELDLAALTQRPFYVAQYQPPMRPGVGANVDFLLKDVKGYSSDLIDRRRSTVREFFNPATPSSRMNALREISATGRPVIVLLNESEDAELADWLRHRLDAKLVGAIEADAAWLIDKGVFDTAAAEARM
jgi:hypothetical protein